MKINRAQGFYERFGFNTYGHSALDGLGKPYSIHTFSDMRKLLVSETGILFKISLTEYYYISFKSLAARTEEEDLLNTLIEGFRKEQIIIKRK